jgi:hypothetical protein
MEERIIKRMEELFAHLLFGSRDYGSHSIKPHHEASSSPQIVLYSKPDPLEKPHESNQQKKFQPRHRWQHDHPRPITLKLRHHKSDP